MDPRESHGETRRQLPSQNMHNSIPIKHTNVIQTDIDHIPSNTGSGAVLHAFEDNEAVIKTIIKGVEVPQWGMFHEPTELLWIGCLTGVILDP